MNTQVDPHIARSQRFSEPWVSYTGIQTPSPVPELPRRASTSAVPSSAPRRSGTMQLVPHRPYPPPHSKTKGQYVDDATLQQPILFDLIGSSQRGVAAKDAVNKRYHNLVGRDDPMFEESGSSVALRFEVSLLLLRPAFVASADRFDSGPATSLGVARYANHLFIFLDSNRRFTTLLP